MNIETTTSKCFGPLSFEENHLEKYNSYAEQECLLCDKKFTIRFETSAFLKHIFEVHNLVIEDFQNIERFNKYVSFWKEKFLEKSIETIVPSVKITETNQQYFLLSTLLKDDKSIRHKLKLDAVVEQHNLERVTIITRNCLFCKLEFSGKIVDYLKHLSEAHNLQLGKPDNLVYVVEFINCIEDKLKSLNCLYCEKTFPDRHVLKEHMRKKLHKRINPSNSYYDRFYIVNYLEADKNWQHLQKEDDNLPFTLDDNSDQEWSDWNESDQEFVCLFCDFKDVKLLEFFDHIKVIHKIDFQSVLNNLEYYQRVKLVNYIRRQLFMNNCVNCDQHFDDKESVREHMMAEGHCAIPDLKIFNQPEYYFPTYENDTLLYYLDEIADTDLD